MCDSEVCCICLDEISLDLFRNMKCCKKNIHIKCLFKFFLYKNKNKLLTLEENCPLCRQKIIIEFNIPEILVLYYLYKDKDKFIMYKNLIKEYICYYPLKYKLPKVYIKEFINDNKSLLSEYCFDYNDRFF